MPKKMELPSIIDAVMRTTGDVYITIGVNQRGTLARVARIVDSISKVERNIEYTWHKGGHSLFDDGDLDCDEGCTIHGPTASRACYRDDVMRIHPTWYQYSMNPDYSSVGYNVMAKRSFYTVVVESGHAGVGRLVAKAIEIYGPRVS